MALKEFAGLLGEALEGLADQKGVASAEGFEIPKDLPESEKELVRRVMSDKEVQEVLSDVGVQRLIAAARGNPEVLMQ